MRRKKLNMPRVFGLFAAIAVLLSALGAFPASAAESGTCGGGLNWSYSAGTLTITGQGKMNDYSAKTVAPWYHLREEISTVVLSDEVTSIGRMAFSECSALRGIYLPDSVRTIGAQAFFECRGLRVVRFPAQLISIGTAAFYGCERLAAISLPLSLERIENMAFYRCLSLVNVTVPRNAIHLGNQIFAYCKSLLRATIEAPIRTIPEWMFYGCEVLCELSLPATVNEVEEYAFKRCDDLTAIYHPGSQNNVSATRKGILESNPSFANGGIIGNSPATGTTHSSALETDKDGNFISQTNTTLTTQPGVTVVTTVERTKEGDKTSYQTSISVTVEGEDAWEDATKAVKDAFLDAHNTHADGGATSEGTTVTVYLPENGAVDEDFLKQLAGRDVIIEVVTSDGSTWRNDCESMTPGDISGDVDFSYTVSEGTDEDRDKLGTDDCYQVDFGSSSQLNTNLLVKLPSEAAGSNAFLYQVEGNGSYNRLQATQVDPNGNAHFYISSVDADTKYVVGLNVPNEKTEDVIRPSQTLTGAFDPVARLEKIEYVSTGVQRFGGFTLTELMLIVIGGLVLAGVVVGVVMYMMNKQKLARMAAGLPVGRPKKK